MGWALDLDGVVWLGTESIPGVAEAVAALQSAGETVLFVTNNSGRCVVDVENKLDNTQNDEEFTPKLFSEDDSHTVVESNNQNEKLFNQTSSDDEEFEIPAFLRKQKF